MRYLFAVCSDATKNPTKMSQTQVQSNQNGAVNRRPSSTSTSDATSLVQSNLTNAVSRDQVGNITLTNLVGSGLDDSDLFLRTHPDSLFSDKVSTVKWLKCLL